MFRVKLPNLYAGRTCIPSTCLPNRSPSPIPHTGDRQDTNHFNLHTENKKLKNHGTDRRHGHGIVHHTGVPHTTSSDEEEGKGQLKHYRSLRRRRRQRSWSRYSSDDSHRVRTIFYFLAEGL